MILNKLFSEVYKMERIYKNLSLKPLTCTGIAITCEAHLTGTLEGAVCVVALCIKMALSNTIQTLIGIYNTYTLFVYLEERTPTQCASRWHRATPFKHSSVSIIHTPCLYILKSEHRPQCEYCQCIRHILVECSHFAQQRKIFGRRDVVESFNMTYSIPVLLTIYLTVRN